MAVNNDIDALKHLYSKLGGASDDVSTINTSSEMIERIGDLVEDGGGSGGGSVSDVVYVDFIPGDGDIPINGAAINITPRELWPQLLAGKRIIVRISGAIAGNSDLTGYGEIITWGGTDFDVKSPMWNVGVLGSDNEVWMFISTDADTHFTMTGN